MRLIRDNPKTTIWSRKKMGPHDEDKWDYIASTNFWLKKKPSKSVYLVKNTVELIETSHFFKSVKNLLR